MSTFGVWRLNFGLKVGGLEKDKGLPSVFSLKRIIFFLPDYVSGLWGLFGAFRFRPDRAPGPFTVWLGEGANVILQQVSPAPATALLPNEAKSLQRYAPSARTISASWRGVARGVETRWF